MDRVKIVENAVLSVDKAYMQARYKGETYIPTNLFYGDRLAPRYKKKVLWACAGEYPGGEIGMVIDNSLFHSFGDGYLFTDKGFYATKGNLSVSATSRKRGIPTLEYVDIVSVELTKKYEGYHYIRIITNDGGDYTGYAGIYAPYICEVIKKIIADLWPKKEKAAKKPQEATAEEPPVEKPRETPAQEEPKQEEPAQEKPASDDPFELGVQAFEEKRYVEALALFRLAASRGCVEACYNAATIMGALAKTSKDYGEALSYLKKYRELGGDKDVAELARTLFGDYYLEKGNEALDQEQLDQAEEDLRKAVQYGSTRAMPRLALLLSANAPTHEKLEEAMSLANQYRDNTDNAEGAQALIREITGVQKLLQAMEALKAEDGKKAYALAKEAARCGDVGAVFLTAEMTVDFGETEQDCHDALEMLEQYAQAGGEKDITQLKQQLQARLQEIAGVQKLLQAMEALKAEDGEKAYALAKEAARCGLEPAILLAAELAADIGKTQGDYTEALGWLEQYAQAGGEKDITQLKQKLQAQLRQCKAEAAITQGDYAGAVRLYRQALELGSKGANGGLALALLETVNSREELAEALSCAEEFQKDYPGDGAQQILRWVSGHVYCWDGDQADKQGDFETAMQCYKKAWSFKYSKAAARIALLLYKYAETEEAYLEAISWAKRYAQCPEHPGAEEIIEELETARYCYAGAEAHKKKHWGEAVSLFRKAAQRGKTEAMFALAVILLQHAKTRPELEDALSWAQKYSKTDPEKGEELVRDIRTLLENFDR